MLAEHTGASPNLSFLGQSAKRVLGRIPSRRFRTSHLELVNEGWLAWCRASGEGASEEHAYRRAEWAMVEFVRRLDRPLTGDTKMLRHITMTVLPPDELFPDRGRSRSHGRRLTRGDWRALRTAFARCLTPTQCRVLTALCCDHQSPASFALDSGMPEAKVLQIRRYAIERMRVELSGESWLAKQRKRDAARRADGRKRNRKKCA